MPINITKIAQQYTSPLARMAGPGSAVQALLAQQERWRKQLLGPSYALQTIRDHLSVQEQFMDQHRKLIASSLSFGINDLIQRTLRVGELANVLGQSSATLELIEQNRRLMDQVARIADPFQDMRDRLKLDQFHPWVSQIAAAAEHARELLESLPDQEPGDDQPNWEVLEDQLQNVQTSIAKLPLAGAFLRDLSANQHVPREIRTEAYRLLRHFPSVSDVAAIAENEARLLEVAKSHLLQNYLVADFDPEWVRGYMSGPHIGG